MEASLPWGDRVVAAVQRKRSAVVVGIDPTLDKLPEPIRAAAAHAQGQTARGAALALHEFGRLLIDGAAEGGAVAVKPQSAFFELYGAAGLAAFWGLVQHARSRDLLVIGDAKRGDIGSTVDAYATAFFGSPTPLDAWLEPAQQLDCLTVNAYTGTDGVLPYQPHFGRGKGILVLVKTSNPSAGELQDRPLAGGETVADAMAALVERWGAASIGASGYSAVGAVTGATYPADLARLRGLMPHAIMLLPGYGAQGAGPQDVVPAFARGGLGALVSASRSVMYAFAASHGQAAGAAQVVQATAAATAAMRLAINAALDASPGR